MTGIILFAIGVSFCLVIFGVPVLRRTLVSKGIYDNPNERSSHSRPTPRGGGIVVLLSIALSLTILWGSNILLPDGLMIVLVLACSLGLVSWIDDLCRISALIRLLCQVVTVATVTYFYPTYAIGALPFLPEWVALLTVATAWIWFINLYNFMDGIDGMTGVETVSICIGLTLLTLTGILADDIIPPLAIIGAAALAFLYWNWSPAKIFLGDVGSIPLGFLLGWFILKAANDGAFVVALIIPGYYLADATITLARRAIRGAPVWQAHREHFYQKPIIYGIAHQRIMLRIILTNLVLIMTAVWLVSINAWLGIAVAVITICALLWNLSQLRS